MIKIYNRLNGELIKEFSFESLSGANMSGADLSGADLRNADMSGADLRNANMSGADLLVINGLEWQVFITKNHIRIGCQSHELGKWENFNDEKIAKMHVNAVKFWKQNKEIVIVLCKRLG